MTAAMPDPERVAAIIREVAAIEVVPHFQALQASDIREKAPGDFVTAADLACEAALTRRLTELVPGSVVLGEEAAAADPSVFARLDGDAPVWVIDPVDGTINFAKGRPGFAVIVAWIRAARTVAGWIHDPLAGVMAMAERGGGAWSDGARLTVAADLPLGAMVGAAYGRVGPTTRTADLLAASGRVGGVVNGMSSGIDYLALVQRRAHFQYASRSLPWDHAAGVLIAQEAGATAGFIDGRPYDPRVRDGALLTAAGAAAWDAIRGIITGAA
jgi:fructose-1,6-bisphosphatase/inositol monophosphatase family enzyme